MLYSTSALDRPAQVARLLISKNWGELAQHFSNNLPICAEEYNARALMNLHRSKGYPDFSSVIKDLRQACVMKPSDLLLAVNLTQSLLDDGQIHEAYETAKNTHKLYPNALPAMEKFVLAAVSTQRWPEAHRTLQHAQQLLGGKQFLPEWAAKLLAELSPCWWDSMMIGGVALRSPDTSDTSFLRKTFQDYEFMQHYHRFQGTSNEAVEAFISEAKLSPRQSRRIDWIILDRNNERVGLAAIVDIDWGNERGEFLIGLPGKVVPMLALKASVAVLKFAFERLRLGKMVSYVYADNPEAQANTLHLGFEQEGLLRSHIVCESGRMDLYLNGMTAPLFAANVFLNNLARRWMQHRVAYQNIDLNREDRIVSDSENSLVGKRNDNALICFTASTGGSYYLGIQDNSTGMVTNLLSTNYLFPTSHCQTKLASRNRNQSRFY